MRPRQISSPCTPGRSRVQHHHVILVYPEAGQGVLAVEGDIDGYPFLA
jgi:hypothetical protein